MSGSWDSGERPSIVWHCGYCEGPVTLSVADRWWVAPQDDDGFDPFEQVLAKCTGCQMAYVLGREADGGGNEGPLEQSFPELDQPLSHDVPQSIHRSHDEAMRCRRAGCHIAAVLMARRGVEAICAEHEASGRTLNAKLDDLKLREVIDSRLHDWSSVVRELGNSGAHDVDVTLSRADADDAIAFLEALVNYLYTFKQRYEDHISRRPPKT